MKIYVGCGISNLSTEDWNKSRIQIESLKQQLRLRGHTILDFKSDTNRDAEPGTVFAWDHEQCMACDAMIAVALHPSTGMGMEIAFCLSRPNPPLVLAVAPRGNNTSKMITECNLPTFTYREFDHWDEIPKMFDEVCGNYSEKK